jgi:hypothetical protein
MKITKKQLKALIREQVAAVVNETDWRDVSDPDYHKPQGEAGPYADEEDEDQDEEGETLKLGTPKHDPMDRSALGKYRKGKMTGFKEGMPEVAGLMSQAGAYRMHPDAMQRLIRVIKEFAPNLPDEQLHDFAQQLIDAGMLKTALDAPEEVELEEKKKKNWAKKASDSIEKKGTEGEFTKYCDGDVTQACVDRAASGSSTKRKKQAAFAANINSHDDLTYPKGVAKDKKK